jgi:hypothetical protein
MRLMELFSRTGVVRLVVDWGGLFPWGLDERFQSRLAYTEQIVSGVDRAVRELGMMHIPRLPVGENVSCFLAQPAYRHMRYDSNDPDVLDPTAPGVGKFVGDILEDIVALLPDLSGVFFDPEPEANALSAYGSTVIETLLPIVGPDIVRLGLTIFMREGAIDCVETAMPRGVAVGIQPIQLPHGDQDTNALPSTAELMLADLGSSTGAVLADNEDIEFTRAHALRECFVSFRELESVCWQLIQSARQTLVMPASLGYCPSRVSGEVGRIVADLRTRLVGLDGLSDELRAGLAHATYESVTAGWLRSRLEPIREEYALLQSRHRQVGAWVETE